MVLVFSDNPTMLMRDFLSEIEGWSRTGSGLPSALLVSTSLYPAEWWLSFPFFNLLQVALLGCGGIHDFVASSGEPISFGTKLKYQFFFYKSIQPYMLCCSGLENQVKIRANLEWIAKGHYRFLGSCYTLCYVKSKLKMYLIDKLYGTGNPIEEINFPFNKNNNKICGKVWFLVAALGLN